MADAEFAGRFYVRWVFANGWAEAVGLGTTLALGRFLVPLLSPPAGRAGLVVNVMAAVVLGALLEGLLVGAAQEQVLRPQFLLPRYRWTLATVVGAALAWAVGIVPSTVMAFNDEPPAISVEQLGSLNEYALAAALGMVTGPILGVAQWSVLRGQVERAFDWLWANALAWAVGMCVIFMGMDFIPWAASTLVVGAAIYLVCGAAGLTVGVIHGVVLLRLIEHPRRGSLNASDRPANSDRRDAIWLGSGGRRP